MSQSWVARSLDAARTQVDRAAERQEITETERALASVAVHELASPEVTSAIERLGEERWKRAVVKLHDGNDAGAIEALGELTFDERRGAMLGAAAEQLAAINQRRADAETVRGALLEIGKKALRILIPLLIASL
jgi:hypothetical protein